MIRAEANAEGTHARPSILFEVADILGDLGAVDDPVVLGKTESDAARGRGQRFGGAQIEERLQQRLGVIGEPKVGARLNPFAGGGRQRFVGEQEQPGPEGVVGLD